MLNRENARELLQEVLNLVPADECEAVLLTSRLERTPFAGNEVGEHTSEAGETLYLRAIVEGRQARGATTVLDPAALRGFATRVASVAREPAMPMPEPQEYQQANALVPMTALYTPEQRAETVRVVIENAASQGLRASGCYYAGVRQISVANTRGLSGCHASTGAGLYAVAEGETSSGYGDGYARDVTQIDPFEVGEIAASKALLGAYPRKLDAGEYEVVLEQNAVADLLVHMARNGLGGDTVASGHSFLSGRLGERVTGPLFTLHDDPLSADGLLSPFDGQGVARQKVDLVRGGVAVGPVHDTCTAVAAGTRSTGHASLPTTSGAYTGPLPCSLFLQHDDDEMEHLIGSVRRGVLISRLAGLNTLDPAGLLLEGVTQHGTFLIEDGQISHPVQDLRFQESLLTAFEGIERRSRERKLVMSGQDLAVVAPALKLAKFAFVE